MVLHLREAEKCPKFSHKIGNSNRRKNSINSLLIDGTISINLLEINEFID
jgi:hypothetical protein